MPQTRSDVEIERFVAACRDGGLHVTPQRIAVLRHLVECGEHPTAEEIYQAVLEDFPTMSRATVYKSLSVLCGLGFASEVGLAGGPGRFEANLDPHHHLVCTRCQSIVDIPASEVQVSSGPAPAGFQVETTRVRFDGLCAGCAAPPGA